MLKSVISQKALIALICTIFLSANAIAGGLKHLEVPAGDLAVALQKLAEQCGVEFIYSVDQLKGLKTKGLHGDYEPKEAIRVLIQGTGLELKTEPNGAILIGMPGAGSKGSSESGPGVGRQSSPDLGSAPPDQSAPPELGSPPPGEAQQAAAESTQLSELTVTGTRIRGVAPSSPVLTVTAETMRAAGQTDLGQALRSLPQSFNGGQNPTVATGTQGIANQNNDGASSVNLRGIGQDATLTLLNGHRMSYDAFSQAVDVSTLPLAAVDQVQVLLDGASAIYGSDAVAGVVNIMLKRDFDGVTALVREGGATEGGLAQQQYDVVGGRTWDGGGFIATYDLSRTGALMSTQRDYLADYMNVPITVIPSTWQSSSVFSGHQDLGDRAHLSLDGIYTERTYSFFQTNSTSSVRSLPDTHIWAAAPTLSFDLPHGWTVSLDGVLGHDDSKYDELVYKLTGALSSTSRGCYCNSERGYEASAEGPILRLPAGDARIAVGTGYRWNGFEEPSYTTPSASDGGSRSSTYGYAEANLPLVGPEQNLAWVERLALNAAVRHESYNDIGKVTTPKIGLVWSLTSDLNVKASWGKSFKAPTLLQQYSTRTAYLWTASSFGLDGPGTIVMDYAGNPDLKPERATTWTTGIMAHPAVMPGLRAEVSYFHIDYIDRVVQPIGVLNNAFTDPSYAPFIIRGATPAQGQNIVSAAGQIINYTGAPWDPSSTVAIIEDQYTNITAQTLHGVDLDMSYDLSAFSGELTLTGNASWLRGSQRLLPGAVPISIVGVVADPTHFRSRAGGFWHRGGFTVSSFVNYVSGEADTRSIPNPRIGDFTTVDLSFDYRLPETRGVLHDLEAQLSATNLLDRAPPYLKPSNTSTVDYDSTNYTALGRMVNLTLSKHW
jgi:outer membrane receptor protein involved in Fe transport